MLRLSIFFALILGQFSGHGAEPKWKHLSSSTGDLPMPGTSEQQTGALVADLDKDGTNDFVISFRQVAPALVWYRRTPFGWDRYVIETNFLTIEAGGAVYDIDGDGDPDWVCGGGCNGKAWGGGVSRGGSLSRCLHGRREHYWTRT